MTTAVEILSATRNLLGDPKAWTQNGWGRDVNGKLITASLVADERACSWCVDGALRRSAWLPQRHRGLHQAYVDSVDHLARAVGIDVGDLWDWNDHSQRTHAEVLAALDKAIQLAKEAEAHAT